MYNVGLTKDGDKRDWGIQRIVNPHEMVMVSPVTSQHPMPGPEGLSQGCWETPIKPSHEDATWFNEKSWPGASTKIEAYVSGKAFEYGKQCAEENRNYWFRNLDLGNLTMLWPTLMKHQKKAVVWATMCFNAGHGTMLAMDTGTGKTLSTLAVADIVRTMENRQLRCIAFGPKAGLGVWNRDIERFAIPDMKALTVDRKNIDEALQEWKDYKGTLFLCTSYGNVVYQTGEELQYLAMSDHIDMTICDESHKIKNPDAKTTKRILTIGGRSHYNICMTATPVTRSVLDQGSQVEHLERGQARKNLVSARYWLCEKFLNENPRFIYNKKSVVDSMARADRGEYFYQIKKEDAIDLPGEVDVEINAEWELSPAIKNLYKQVHAALDIGSYSDFDKLTPGAIRGTDRDNLVPYTGKPIIHDGHEVALTHVHLMSMLYRCSEIVNGMLTVWDKDENGNVKRMPIDKSKDDLVLGDRISKRIILWNAPKLQMLKSLLSYMKPPMVVVGRYTTEMEIIRTVAEANGLKCGEISGRIKDGVDHNTEMRKDLDLVAVSIGAGSESIDLTRASDVIYYGVGYNFAAYEQMRGRSYRIGQTKKVTHHILRTHKSIDDHVWGCMYRKKDLVKTLEASTIGVL